MGFVFKMMLRTFSRNKLFSVINIVGLSAGLAVSLLIFMLVYNELSFDRSFSDYKDIYRINSVLSGARAGQSDAKVPEKLAEMILESVPGVQSAVRIGQVGHTVKTETFEGALTLMWVDPDFFTLFDTPILYGSFEEALSEPNKVAMGKKQAEIMFGPGDPTGKTLLFGNMLMEVRAVYDDFPENSTPAGRQVYASMPEDIRQLYSQNGTTFETFILLEQNADPSAVATALEQIAADSFAEQEITFSMQSLKDIHLHSEGISGGRLRPTQGDPAQVRLFSILAVVILLIACINYMNLSTAQAQKRLREITLNKILGAQRGNIVLRSYLESALLTFIAFLIAFGLCYLLLPTFSNLMGVQLSYEMIWNKGFLLALVVIFLFTVLFSASYAAIYLSQFPPIIGAARGGTRYKTVREILSVAQFAVAIVLITWVIVIDTQTRYIYSKDLGFKPEQLIGIWIRMAPSFDSFGAFEEDLARQSSVISMSRMYNFPNNTEMTLRKNTSDEGTPMKVWSADERVTDMLELDFIAGRPLSPMPTQHDSTFSIVLNRTAVAYLESTPDEIVGTRIHVEGFGNPLPVIVTGVVEDFNFESLNRPIVPAAFLNAEYRRFYLVMRVSDPYNADNIAAYKEIFERHFPADVFDVTYIRQVIERNYGGIKKTESLLLLFTLLAILMACMGVFALTTYLVEQRTKEIGVRRVLGSTASQILGLFARTYLRLLAIALVIAIPVSILVSNNYLNTFAFHIKFSWWMIAAATGITLVLVLISVIVPAIKAANANPVKNLQIE